MTLTAESIEETINSLDREVDVDLFLKQLNFMADIDQARMDIKQGRGIPQEEIESRVAQWPE